VAAKQTISSEAHASVEHAQQRREVERSACKCGTRAAEKRGRSKLRLDAFKRSADLETIERMRLPPT
jgi:hypothetical protein